MSLQSIALSAGHNPNSPGACYPPRDKGGTCEYSEAVIWVTLLRHLLEEEYLVVEVPTGRLTDKVKNINALNVDMAIEIHFNACGGCSASGSETLHFPGSITGKDAAQNIQDELGKVFTPDRGAKAGWFRMDRPGVEDYPGDIDGDERPDYFLRKTNCVALIIEPEFIHNHYKISELRHEGAVAIARGVQKSLDMIKEL